MAVVPEGGPEGTLPPQITPHRREEIDTVANPDVDEKKNASIEVNSTDPESDFDEATKIYVPDDDEEVIDPRLKDYPVPLVAKTVDLHNDFK